MTDLDRRSFLSVAGAAGMQPLLSPLVGATRVPDGLWSYLTKPVQVKNPDLKGDWHVGAQYAFDGYGGSVHPHSLSHCWVQDGVPSESRPFFCAIDYGTTVAVRALVHYFYNPDVKDYRADALLLSTAFRSVNLYVSRDGKQWEVLERWRDLPDVRPQILSISRPTEARHYKLEIVEMAPGARGIRTYEIETYTDGSFHGIQTQRGSLQAPALPFNGILEGQIADSGRLQNADLAMEWSLADGTPTLSITPAQGGAAVRASLHISYNDEPLRFEGRVRRDASVVFRSLNVGSPSSVNGGCRARRFLPNSESTLTERPPPREF